VQISPAGDREVPTIRLMSWNVESFGDAKAKVPPNNPSELIGFVAAIVNLAGADLVGLMEVKAGVGKTLTGWLTSKLNAVTAPKTWSGRWSTRQDGGTQEEYILLWRSDSNLISLDNNTEPGPTSLVGVVDTNAFAGLLRGSGWTKQQKQDFYAALATKKYARRPSFKFRRAMYTTKWWRVDPQTWNQASTNVLTQVDLSGTPVAGMLTVPQLQDVARKLLQIDILQFPETEERSPYIGNFLLGTNQRPVSVALFHAQGPGVPKRYEAINIIGMSRVLASAPAAVLMGDFNVQFRQMGALGRVWVRTPTKFQLAKPTTYVKVFKPITDAPPNGLGMTNHFPQLTDLTSLGNRWLADSATVADALVNTYDKVFTRGSANVTASNPQIFNLLRRIAGDQGAFQQNLARSALTFFRAFRVDPYLADQRQAIVAKKAKVDKKLSKYVHLIAQNMVKINAQGGYATLQANTPNSPLLKRDKNLKFEMQPLSDQSNEYQAELNNIDDFTKFAKDATKLEPYNIAKAHGTYRFAVSDHLPITIDLAVT
jgi:hypothetical protein